MVLRDILLPPDDDIEQPSENLQFDLTVLEAIRATSKGVSGSKSRTGGRLVGSAVRPLKDFWNPKIFGSKIA